MVYVWYKWHIYDICMTYIHTYILYGMCTVATAQNNNKQTKQTIYGRKTRVKYILTSSSQTF